ncbi:MAG: hypothetical protein H0V44_14110 [Planctomycetes bacterium]|nr:hypothetical protein [Planctomycetota bacterium]
MSLHSDARAVAVALVVLLWSCGCGASDRPASPTRSSAPVVRAPVVVASDERVAMLLAAYRFELALHASDADRAEFGGFFLDYPAEHEGTFLSAFAWQAPPVRARRYCRITREKAVIDIMTGAPGISFVAEIKSIDGPRALVAMTWYTDQESGAGTMLGMERRPEGWQVTGCEVLWAR